jgi:hypothetical protein
VTSLKKKRTIFIYAWKKIQKEVHDYWKDKSTQLPQYKLAVSEDQRLPLMAYAIINSQCDDIYTSFLALNPFIDFNMMEEGVPLATVENAIQIIMNEYNDREGVYRGDNTSDNGGANDAKSKVQYDLVSQNKITPSQMSDNVSMRSATFKVPL